jgi:hypothetical protein
MRTFHEWFLTDSWMYVLAFMVVVGWLAMSGLMLHARELGRQDYYTEQQSQVPAWANMTKSYDATRTEPPVMLIQRITPDYAQVCVEPAKDGVVACRPIGDLRKWIVSPAPPPCPPVVKK